MDSALPLFFIFTRVYRHFKEAMLDTASLPFSKATDDTLQWMTAVSFVVL